MGDSVRIMLWVIDVEAAGDRKEEAMAIKWVEGLNEYYQSQGFPPYKWSTFEDSLWTPCRKSLPEARIGLVSSAGITLDEQVPFEGWAVDGLDIRLIPTDVPQDRLVINHNYYDHRAARKDINCVFPYERLRELASNREIGSLAHHAVSLGMGRLYKRSALVAETVPRIRESLQAQKVDAVLLVPA